MSACGGVVPAVQISVVDHIRCSRFASTASSPLRRTVGGAGNARQGLRHGFALHWRTAQDWCSGNGWPVVGAPGFTGVVNPARPCEVMLAVVWQPLQVLVSPGSSCSQLVCSAVTRRAFTSMMSMVKGTLAGT